MKDYTITLSLTADGQVSTFSFSKAVENGLAAIALEDDGERLRVTVEPKRELTINSAVISCGWACSKKDRILLNGYQSWTDTRELEVNSRMYGLRRTPRFAIKRFCLNKYGDYHFVGYSGKKGDLHGISYGYIRREGKLDFIGSLNERTGYTVIRLNTKKQALRIEKDCAGLCIDQPYEVFDLVRLSGEDDQVFDRYFALMGIDRPRHKPLRGYTSWYNHYQNINSDIINRNLEGMRSLPVEPEIFQIDDGYQTAVGDWLSIDKKKFPDGLKPVVEAIHADNMLAGLWLAPFVCETNSEIYKNKPDWLLKGEDGQPIYCACSWSRAYALDLEHPEVCQYLKEVFDTVLNDFGFDFVKLDFLYAASFIGDSKKTRGQRMCEAMDLLRELVGGKLILGCGVPMWPSFGKVDYCRIGCDVSLDWDDKLIMRLIHRERVSTRNAICDSIYRRQLDGRAFWNDPDVFLLRYDNMKMSKKRKSQLAKVNGLFGSVLFMSDNAGAYDEKQMAQYTDTVSMGDAEIKSVTSKGNRICIRYTHKGKDEKLTIRL